MKDDPEETQSVPSAQSSPKPPHENDGEKDTLWQALHRQNGKLILLYKFHIIFLHTPPTIVKKINTRLC